VEVNFTVVGSFYYRQAFNGSSENEYCYILTGKTDGKIYPNNIEIAQVRNLDSQELNNFCTENADKLTPWFIKAGEYLNLTEVLWPGK